MSIFGFSFLNQRQTAIGKIFLDVLEEETLTLPGDVTKYPVENGTEISDHIFIGAETLRIQGKVSNTSGMMFDISGGLGSSRLLDAIEALRALRAERTLIEISTGVMTYTDMGIASIRLERSSDQGGGNWLNITLDAVKITKVKLRTAEVPAAPATAGRTGTTATPAGRSTPSAPGATTPTSPQQGPQRPVSAAARLADGAATSTPDSVLGQAARMLGGR